MRLLDPLFTTDRMREIFSDASRLQRMLDFEAALARALAHAGVAPAASRAAIRGAMQSQFVRRMTRWRVDAALAGNLAIPLVKALTALVAKSDEKAAGFVHLGATSQDAIDTGLVLQLRDAFDVHAENSHDLSDALARLPNRIDLPCSPVALGCNKHRPITFGLKFAGWLDAVESPSRRLA